MIPRTNESLELDQTDQSELSSASPLAICQLWCFQRGITPQSCNNTTIADTGQMVINGQMNISIYVKCTECSYSIYCPNFQYSSYWKWNLTRIKVSKVNLFQVIQWIKLTSKKYCMIQIPNLESKSLLCFSLWSDSGAIINLATSVEVWLSTINCGRALVNPSSHHLGPDRGHVLCFVRTVLTDHRQ